MLEADLMDTMNDHIQHVHFKFKGKSELLGPHLRLELQLSCEHMYMD